MSGGRRGGGRHRGHPARPTGIIAKQDAARRRIRNAIRAWVQLTNVHEQKQLIEVEGCMLEDGTPVDVALTVHVRDQAIVSENLEYEDTAGDMPAEALDAAKYATAMTFKSITAHVGIISPDAPSGKLPGIIFAGRLPDGTITEIHFICAPDEMAGLARKFGDTASRSVVAALCACLEPGSRGSLLVPSCPIHGSSN